MSIYSINAGIDNYAYDHNSVRDENSNNEDIVMGSTARQWISSNRVMIRNYCSLFGKNFILKNNILIKYYFAKNGFNLIVD